MERDYDFDEICPHCDYVNQVVWDGKSMTTICKGCGETITLCTVCEHCGDCCWNCEYEEKER